MPPTSSRIRFHSERYAEAYASFTSAYPEYGTTTHIDTYRARDYGRLDAHGQTYLDYTGGGLYGESQIRAHHDLLANGVFGNPHSHNPTSLAATELVEEARAAVRDFFHASADEYDVVFTSNASGALKLIGEAFPFEAGGTYLLSFDNHNSVNGIREYARRNGAQVIYVPVRDPDLRLDERLVRHHLQTAARGPARLFAYPAQSNFSGVQHPLEWIALARAAGWQVLLDAAAFAPTNRLDLSECRRTPGPARGAGLSAASLVLRRDHHPGVGPGRGLAPPRARPRRIRGRHRRLPGTACGHHRSAPPS